MSKFLNNEGEVMMLLVFAVTTLAFPRAFLLMFTLYFVFRNFSYKVANDVSRL